MRHTPTDYAATIAAHMRAGCDLERVTAGLELCAGLRQLWEFPGGCVGFLRAEWHSLPWFAAKDWAAMCALPVHELSGGPVLYVAEILALQPGYVLPVTRALAQLPGVEALAAHRDEGSRWKVQKVRHELGRRK